MYGSASIVKDAWHRCPLVIVETQAVLNTDTLVLGTLENSRNAFRKMQKNSEGILDCKFLDVLGTSTWLLPFPEFPALNGLYLTIFVVSPMASGFLNSWDTLARDLRADAPGWDTVTHGFLHTPSEHLAMPNPGPNANCPKRSENARRAGSGTLERAAVPQHRCNIARNAWRNPQCLRGSCYPTYGNGNQWAHDSGVFQRHGSGSGGDW